MSFSAAPGVAQADLKNGISAGVIKLSENSFKKYISFLRHSRFSFGLTEVMVVAAVLCMLPSLIFRTEVSAYYEDRGKIENACFSQKETLNILERFLGEENLLTSLKIREKLLSLSISELEALREKTSGEPGYVLLNDFIKLSLQDKPLESKISDIIVNVTPFKKPAPFLEGHKGNYYLSDLAPYAERVYFSNPEFEYSSSDLIKKDCSHWVNPEYAGNKSFQLKEELQGNPSEKRAGNMEPELLWIYKNECSRITNSIATGPRKPMPLNYEGRSIYPEVKDGVLFFRNKHRIFSLDSYSGREIWSFPREQTQSSEYYYTYSHPHPPVSGRELLVTGERIYSELSGKFTALEIKSSGFPELLWEKDLGEFALCAKPVKSDNVIVAVLINPRGNMWVNGYHVDNGQLLWNKYIGLSSYSVSASSIYKKYGDALIIGTNHGVVFSLLPDSGELLWIRRYESKEFDLNEYWLSEGFNKMLQNRNIIEYETGFMELGRDDCLYYKPRESGHLYIICPETGRLREQILFGGKYKVLRAKNSKVYVLLKEAEEDKNILKGVKLDTGEVIFKEHLIPGELKGVLYKPGNETVFKIGPKLYFFRSGEDQKTILSAVLDSESWLSYVSGQNVLLSTKEEIKFVNLKPGSAPYENTGIKRKLGLRDHTLATIEETVSQKPSNKSIEHLHSMVLSDSELFRARDFYEILESNIENSSNRKWRPFIKKLNHLYGKEIIKHKNVYMRFSGYLEGAGLIERKTYSVKKPEKIQEETGGFKATCQSLHILRHKNILNEEPDDFFFVSQNGQLLCVQENGVINWASEIHFQPNNILSVLGTSFGNLRGKNFLGSTPEIYVFRDTVIINDRINLIGLNAEDGSYSWSITQGRENLNKYRTYTPDNPDELFRKYDVDRNFLSEINILSDFIGGDLIFTRNNMIYKLDPETGYVLNKKQLRDIDEISSLKANDGFIHIYSLKTGIFYKIDSKFNISEEITVNQEETSGKNADPNIFFSENFYVFQFPHRSIIICRETGESRYEVTGNGGYDTAKALINEEWIAFVNDENLKKIRFETLNEYPEKKPESDLAVYLPEGSIKCREYYYDNDFIIIPRVDRGEIVFEKHILNPEYTVKSLGVTELYPELTDEYEINVPYMFYVGGVKDTLYYWIISVSYDLPYNKIREYTNIRNIIGKTNLIGICLKTGAVNFQHEFPKSPVGALTNYGVDLQYGLQQFAETSNFILYCFSGRLLFSSRKP